MEFDLPHAKLMMVLGEYRYQLESELDAVASEARRAADRAEVLRSQLEYLSAVILEQSHGN